MQSLKDDYSHELEMQIDQAYSLGALIYFDSRNNEELVDFRTSFLFDRYGIKYGDHRFVSVINEQTREGSIAFSDRNTPFLFTRNASCNTKPEGVGILLSFLSIAPVVGQAASLTDATWRSYRMPLHRYHLHKN